MSKAAPLRSWHAERSDGDGGTRVFNREWRAKGEAADEDTEQSEAAPRRHREHQTGIGPRGPRALIEVDQSARPACMDAEEYADWTARNRSAGAEKAATPCHDCLPGFAADMRSEGRCNGTPLGQITDEEEPALPEVIRRRSRHMQFIHVDLTAPCETCAHATVCKYREQLRDLNEARITMSQEMPEGVNVVLSGTIGCIAYLRAPNSRAAAPVETVTDDKPKRQYSPEGLAHIRENVEKARAAAAARRAAASATQEPQDEATA